MEIMNMSQRLFKATSYFKRRLLIFFNPTRPHQVQLAEPLDSATLPTAAVRTSRPFVAMECSDFTMSTETVMRWSQSTTPSPELQLGRYATGYCATVQKGTHIFVYNRMDQQKIWATPTETER